MDGGTGNEEGQGEGEWIMIRVRAERLSAVEDERDRLARSVDGWTETARVYAINAADWQAKAAAMRPVVEAAEAYAEARYTSGAGAAGSALTVEVARWQVWRAAQVDQKAPTEAPPPPRGEVITEEQLAE